MNLQKKTVALLIVFILIFNNIVFTFSDNTDIEYNAELEILTEEDTETSNESDFVEPDDESETEIIENEESEENTDDSELENTKDNDNDDPVSDIEENVENDFSGLNEEVSEEDSDGNNEEFPKNDSGYQDSNSDFSDSVKGNIQLENTVSFLSTDLDFGNLIEHEKIYRLPEIPSGNNYYVLAWYPTDNRFGLGTKSQPPIWDNAYAGGSEFDNSKGALNVDKLYGWNMSSGSDWQLVNSNINWVVWHTNADTTSGVKAPIFSNQTINYSSSGKVWFNKSNYDFSDVYLIKDTLTLSSDYEIDSDFMFIGDIDLNGYNLTINGNLTQIGGKLDINGGELDVMGDYIIGAGENNSAYASLIMKNENDYVKVAGDFTIYTIYGSEDNFSAGTLEISGDFTQESFDEKGYSNFESKSEHRVLLNGSEIQNIHFDNLDYSSLNELIITKPLEKGYKIDSETRWNILTEEFDEIPPTVPTGLKAEVSGFSNVKLSWDEASDNVKVLGYNVYRDNRKIATVDSLEYTDNVTNLGREYEYKITAMDYCNESEMSEPALINVEELPYEKVEYNGNQYAFIDESMPWTEAKEFCEAIGGHLVTITTAKEQEFIYNELLRATQKTKYWLGGEKNDGKWEWITSEPLIYTNWAPGEPNNFEGVEKYICLRLDGGEWNDIRNNGGPSDRDALSYFGIICEWETVNVNMINPESGSILTANPTLRITAVDNEKLALLEAYYRPINSDTWSLIDQITLNSKSAVVPIEWDTDGIKSGEYEVKVEITNSRGIKSEPLIASYTLKTDPPASSELTIVPEALSMILTWSNVDEDVSFYKVYRSSDEGKSYRLINTTTENTYTDLNLLRGVTYYYKVEAINIYGNSSTSEVKNGVPLYIDTVPPKANAGYNTSTIIGEETAFDGSNSTDNVGVVSYLWDFGDGNTSTEANPIHTYSEISNEDDYNYTVSLTVADEAGNTNTSSITVTVYPADQTGILELTVKEKGGKALKDAYVYVDFPDTPKHYKTNASGKVRIFAIAGNYNISAYKTGYLPNEENIAIEQYQTNQATIEIENSEIVTAETSVKPMTVEEIKEAGIDTSSKDNQYVYTIDTTLVFEKETVSEPVKLPPIIVNGGGTVYTGGEPVYYNSGSSGGGSSSGSKGVVVPNVVANEEHPEVAPTVAYLVIPNTVSWLKEFFLVNMIIDNHALPQFVIQDSTVTLSLPDGVSLAPTAVPQSYTIDLGDIAGQESAQTEWIVRGDESGLYNIEADFEGTLLPFYAPVEAHFQTENAIEVLAENAVKMYVTAEDMAFINEFYYPQFKIENRGYKPIYNLEFVFGMANESTATGTRYVIESLEEQIYLPFMKAGDSIFIEELPVGGIVGGIYETVFLAEGDPDSDYYKLLETIVSNSEGGAAGIEVEVERVPSSHLIAAAIGGSTDSYDAGQLIGQEDILWTLYYNSLVDISSEFGKGWSYPLDITLTTDAFGNKCLRFPDGSKYFFRPDYRPIEDSELTDDEVNVNINTMILEGYKPISRGSKRYTIKEDGENIIIENGNREKYTMDKDGNLLRYEDKTGYSIDLTREEDSVKITETSTGNSMIINLDNQGFATSVKNSSGEYSFSYNEEGNLVSAVDNAGVLTEFSYVEEGLSQRLQKNAENVSKTVFENEYADGRLVKRTDGKGNSRTYSYDDASEFWRIKVTEADRNGDDNLKVFNRFGELVNYVNELGNETFYTYDLNGNRTSIMDANRNTVLFEYDDYNNLTLIKDAEEKQTKFEYDGKSNLTKILNSDGTVIKNEYNSTNLMTKLIDERGNETFLEYDNDGNLVKVTAGGYSSAAEYEKGKVKSETDFNGNTRTFEYNSDGEIKSVTNALNEKVSYEYDEKKRIVRVVYPDDLTELYTYDDFNNILTSTDRNGNISAFEYDVNNNLVAVTDAGGNKTTFAYDNEEQLLTVTDSKGNTQTITYDAAGQIINETDFEGNTISYAYDSAGRLTSSKIGEALTKYSYYKTGRLHTVTDVYGNETSYYYDSGDRVTSVKDALGNISTYGYDLSGNLTAVTTPLGYSNAYSYNFRNDILSYTDANGNISTYEYDGNGNLVKQSNPLGEDVAFTYDELNRQTGITDANGNTQTIVYDIVGNISEVLKPLNVKSRMTYDGNGNVLEIFDSNNVKVNTSDYDYNNNVVSSTNALGNSIGYEYDSLGLVTKYTNALGNSYSYEYNAGGRIVQVTDPLEGVVKTAYDGRGNQVSFTDENDNETEYAYDLLNRLIEEISAAGYSDSYNYNPLSLLTGYTNKRGQAISYEYDVDGRLTSRTAVEGATTYSYDSNGNLLTVTNSQGTIERAYDELNRVVSYKDARGNTIGYKYDTVGNLSELEYPNGKVVRYSYNANNQLEKVTDWAGRVTIYTYDNNQRLTSTERPDGSIETYAYDAAGQLTGFVDKDKNGTVINEYEFEYDATGNIIREDSANEPENIVIPQAEMTYGKANRLTEFNGTAIEYDADGNMLNTPLGEAWGSLNYNSFNMLTDVVLSDSAVTDYEYDALGNRTGKVHNGIETKYVVNNSSLSSVLISETEGESTYYIYGLGLIGQEKNEEYKVYHFDSRGSTIAITDEAGTVTDRVFYDPYGNVVERTGTTETPFLYVGKYGVETDESELYYMRARYYNPTIQRFINVDPIKDGSNWYGYVEGNPLLYIDPLGEFSWSELKEKTADIGLGILAGSSDFGVNTLSGLFYLPAYAIDEVSYSLGYNLESRKKVMSIADEVRDYNASYYRQFAKSEKAFSTAQKTTRIVEEVGSLVLAVGATTKAIGAMGKAVKGGTALRAMQFSTGGTILIPSIEAGAIAAAAGRIAVFGGFGGIVYSSAGSSGSGNVGGSRNEWKTIVEEKSASRVADALSPKQREIYNNTLEKLAKGDTSGLNIHRLTNGKMSADLKGFGQGRGNARIYYTELNGKINILEIDLAHMK